MLLAARPRFFFSYTACHYSRDCAYVYHQHVCGILVSMYVLEGELPSRQMRLVLAWIELHRDELMADRILASAGQMPYKIEPLR